MFYDREILRHLWDLAAKKGFYEMEGRIEAEIEKDEAGELPVIAVPSHRRGKSYRLAALMYILFVECSEKVSDAVVMDFWRLDPSYVYMMQIALQELRKKGVLPAYNNVIAWTLFSPSEHRAKYNEDVRKETQRVHIILNADGEVKVSYIGYKTEETKICQSWQQAKNLVTREGFTLIYAREGRAYGKTFLDESLTKDTQRFLAEEGLSPRPIVWHLIYERSVVPHRV